jgi:3-oxoacyl-[acyl-carrier-protein] synthase II
MSRAPVITGVGLVTPLGVGVAASWTALLAGRHVMQTGVAPIERDPSVSRVGQLGLIAVSEALGDATPHSMGSTAPALVVGTSKGPADEWLRDPTTAAGLSTLSDDIARRLPFATSPRLTLSAACASGLHALTRAIQLFESGDTNRAIVVASESSLHPMWHGTFKRLGVLPPPGEVCRPFDTDRHGFLISEAAAAVVLEYREPAPGDLIITRSIIAADATHLTGSDPDGRSLRHVLKYLSDDAGPVGFVHAHATATGNDPIELDAIRAVFGSAQPDVYSHKGAIGHTLGASGLVALAISTQIHRTNVRPPMPTVRAPFDPLIATSTHHFTSLNASLILASGFGGALAGTRLERA